MTSTTDNRQTPLHALHEAAGAKMVPFAGYAMPMNYPLGIVKEHLHTRAQAGLFDVSHMGSIRVHGADAATRLEALIPADLVGLAVGRQRYGLLTNEHGGVRDDLMCIRVGEEEFILVVNAACKDADADYLSQNLAGLTVEMLTDQNLLALQGPMAAAVMARLGVAVSALKFMDAAQLNIGGIPGLITRSGYTGEDGFELSVANADAPVLAARLLEDPTVQWVGLGARDSLRLEAGLSLYGHELDTATTPVEAGLTWAIPRVRRAGGERAGGFPGASIILPQLPRAVARISVALSVQERAVVRAGAELQDSDGQSVGRVTSGGFSPNLGRPICLARVKTEYSAVDTRLVALVRNKPVAVVVTKLPFIAHRYCR